MINLKNGRFIYAVSWLNPYTEPPSGNRIIAWGQSRWKSPDLEMRDAVWAYCPPGYATVVYVGLEDPKLMSPEKLAKMRRTRKENNYRKKYPLLADMMIQDDLKRKPDYYSVEGCREHQEYKKKRITHYNKLFIKKFSLKREIRL